MKEYKGKMSKLSLKYEKSPFPMRKITDSTDLHNVFRQIFDEDTIGYIESVHVLYMNGANKTIGYDCHAKGGTYQCVADVLPILTQCLLSGASAVAISHNHPSGQVMTSREDDRLTKRLKEACDIIGIRFLDHLVLSGTDETLYYSYADNGKI